ncbi:DNA polymerase sigma [Magnaporthiopsis poae ATCC 64411]|uniref:polynucleotide adenylyltransferase n=1 Tax=Magnaporthiopsis poae (strain ATCC 64411 / 73-15) TaxID=644358 RepID=A0A0C4DP37_MAGP6|nr:DNA polymerase sigma [Magnaporthiopsis poae ATCC 64411]
MSSYRPQRPSQHRGSGGGGGGAGGRDSYHPRDDARRRQYRPQPSSYNDYYNTRSSHHPPPPGFDTFRPPQGDFTFRAEKPPGVQDIRYDGRDATGGGGSHRRDRRNNRPDHGRWGGERHGGGQGRPYHNYQPVRLAADRPILNTTLDSNKELSFKESASGVTYRALGDLSDSDEAEMDISGNEQEGGSVKASAHGSKKRRLAAEDASGNSVPKWSNPDPYTAAPPPDISQQKKKDVVHLIRKARVQPTAGLKPAVPQESADFIPCNLDDSDGEDFVALPPDNSRRGGQLDASLSSKTPHTLSLPAAPTSNLGQKTHGKSSAAALPGRPLSLPSRPPPPADLGSRKRTHDDEIKVPEHAKLKKHTTKMSPGYVLPEWLPVSGKSSCPWVTTDHSSHHSVAIWLHKELVDFYEYVKPRDFEDKLRQSLVDELEKQVRNTWKDSSVYPFGSFKSGLYLPTGDMDLVVCSDKFMGSSIAQYNPRRHVFNFARFVERRGLAHHHHVEKIHKARVPLVKYVDARTGLKVDISFENLAGIAAIRTFLTWKQEFPAMPILVTVIKHFLAMRGLNEPANGGIGGFSVICLVVSMLQLMPEVQSRSMIPEQHLGQLLLSFFDLYGNKFQYRRMAISLRPPRYVPKNQVQTFAYKTRDRFSIIDPNNPENDIAGGSSNSSMVQFAFSQASAQLRDRIAFLARSPVNAPFSSVLEPIFAGNYTTFDEQRQHMRALWDRADFGRQ